MCALSGILQASVAAKSVAHGRVALAVTIAGYHCRVALSVSFGRLGDLGRGYVFGEIGVNGAVFAVGNPQSQFGSAPKEIICRLGEFMRAAPGQFHRVNTSAKMVAK